MALLAPRILAEEGTVVQEVDLKSYASYKRMQSNRSTRHANGTAAVRGVSRQRNMKVINIHRRILRASPKDVGALIDTLSSKNDLLWPHKLWPKMEFDKPLSVSANGGHGPIRYFVGEYSAGKRIKFCFTGPTGFDGYHGYDAIELEPDKTELIQTLKMETSGIALLTWPLLFRPLHDALIEDSLSFAELHLNLTPTAVKWSLYVKFLRWVMSLGKGREQQIS